MTLISAIGLARIAGETVLDVWYPRPVVGSVPERIDFPEQPAPSARVRTAVVTATIDADDAPASTQDVYLRLHALSHRLVQPNQINVDGIFAALPNVAWTSRGPLLPEDVETERFAGPLTVLSVDKFPRMVDYVIPSGVRVADADRVRLGAHLAHGTTVMHEGFVNFNAGTLGVSMVEGRISQGVTVGDGSDIGGGASIMGTLSGGGRERVSIGERSLLGANAGLGIALGDDCVVEAGLYLTAGTKVAFEDRVIAARELSGANGILFRRHSLSGAVQAIRRSGVGIELNRALHS